MTPRLPFRPRAPLAATALPILLLAVLLSGCAAGRAQQPGAGIAPLPFGEATRATLALQIANPDAARQAHARGQAAAGMDGAAANQAQGRYQKSFTEAAPQQGSFTIGVSGAK